ncbi:hypothetical protein KC19_12G061700 [Ceratodon purpureus]|uniref:Uncharacterized protein n=1 Tax=Ceratodon purpureus TaxID=3225 RepID=A0A8T0G5B6_CERPU|nr:hypothetical protein KC19_12G061700 [Ceratodon purpureus]
MSYEVIACHGVLQKLLSEVARGPDPWDYVFTDQSWEAPAICTFEDVDRARAVCKLWKNTVDASAEYATIRLARFEYAQVAADNWNEKAEFEAARFNMSWNIFSTSWVMAVPFSDARYRTLPLGSFTNSELLHLRERLSGPGNTPIWLEEGQKISNRPDIWVAQHSRA